MSEGNSEQKNRVVVTGIGIVHALGLGIEPYWQSLLAGKSGIDKITYFDTTEYTCKIGSEIREDFQIGNYMDIKDAKRNDRFVHYAVAATRLAMQDADFDVAKTDATRVGAIVASGIGGLETVQNQAWLLKERGPRKVSPFMIPSLISNMASGVVAIETGAKGPNFSIVSACSSATHALGEAMHMIQRGDADVIIAGGTEAAITQVGFGGFCQMRAMSTSFNDDPTRASRPFDALRDGFVMGDGAGILILESEAHARARGAKIYCALTGYAATCDAHHITSPDPEGAGLALAFDRALAKAKLPPEAIDYINAHGTSTPYNDKFETMAIKRSFGEHARKLLISSTKSMTGHLLGAAGAVEAAVCAKAITEGIVPPTINYENPDPDCDLDYVPNEKRVATVNAAASSNLGFGGHNAVVVFNRV